MADNDSLLGKLFIMHLLAVGDEKKRRMIKSLFSI